MEKLENSDKFYVKGGAPLFGSLEIGCAKNAYLPILAASLLCDGEVILKNLPSYLDIHNMILTIESLGVKTKIKNNNVHIFPNSINKYEVSSEFSCKTRSSFFCLGAILGRFKKAKVAYPGGCEIGARPIDLHLKGLEALNVKITDRHGYISCEGKNMKGATVHLDFPSVGATENIMLAAALTKGTTKIINAAKEPEVVDLQNFLNQAGAKIKGAGSHTIIIQGVSSLHSVEYLPIPDRIIAGTYVIANAICGGEIILKNTNSKHLTALLTKLDNNGCKFWNKNDKIIMQSKKNHRAIKKIETMGFPGFPTDLQPQIVALLATARGTSVLTENLFETRFRYVNELIKMGADIIIKDRNLIIKGVPKLYGAEVFSHDLRGGAGLVLAALNAEGFTTIDNVLQIMRGYANLEKDLACLGANIKRISE